MNTTGKSYYNFFQDCNGSIGPRTHINSIKFLRSLLNWCEKHKTRFEWLHLPLNVLTRITMLCFPGYQNSLQKKTVTFIKQNLTAGNVQFWAHYTFIVLSNSRQPSEINKKTQGVLRATIKTMTKWCFTNDPRIFIVTVALAICSVNTNIKCNKYELACLEAVHVFSYI